MGKYTDALRTVCKSRGLNYVGLRGDPYAPLWFVGEAPGANEDQEGLPFVGASGKELDRMIAEAGLSQQDCCFTNPYKVRPPDNDLARLDELGIPRQLFLEQFYEELDEYKPKILILCGATPLGLLCQFTISKRDGEAKIGRWRGSLLSSDRLKWPHYVVPMYHPAFVLREWSERQIAIFCVERAREELDFWRQHGSLNPLPQRELIVKPSFDDVLTYLRTCRKSSEPISVDIELLGRRIPYTIAVASSPRSAMSFSLWDYDTEHLVKMWRSLDELLRTHQQIGQNYLGFDCVWLESLRFSPTASLTEDTMVRHHVLWPEFEHTLQFQGFQYTRQPYWKDEGKLWKASEGIEKLMRYNALDAAATYEVFLGQEKEFGNRPDLHKFYNEYERILSVHFHSIEKKGILVDPQRLEDLRSFILQELEKECQEIEKTTGKPAAANKFEAAAKAIARGIKDEEVLNLNAPTQIIKTIKSFGIKVPTDRKTHKESSREEHLQKLFADTGHPFLKSVLVTRELNKILGTYVNAKLTDNTLFTSYVVTGTVSGRRSSRTNVFGLGSNHQNIPKHSSLGKRFRRCMVARPGRLFINCDQAQAEDWIVQAIIADVSGEITGLDQLHNGIDRHMKLAAFIFGKPESACGKETPERFLGKKTRHAANYDMQAETMSLALAKEGYSMAPKYCDFLLTRFHQYEPHIRGVYHKWVQERVLTDRFLRTPLGRERYFLSARPYSDNHKIFREAYAYIPQSTVADNTGMALNYIEDRHPGWIVIEDHDALKLEVQDDDTEVFEAVRLLGEAFNRELTFPNGLKIKIPIEVEMGYDLESMLKCRDFSSAVGLKHTLTMLREQRSLPQPTISGQQPPSSEQASNVMRG